MTCEFFSRYAGKENEAVFVAHKVLLDTKAVFDDMSLDDGKMQLQQLQHCTDRCMAVVDGWQKTAGQLARMVPSSEIQNLLAKTQKDFTEVLVRALEVEGASLAAAIHTDVRLALKSIVEGTAKEVGGEQQDLELEGATAGFDFESDRVTSLCERLMRVSSVKHLTSTSSCRSLQQFANSAMVLLSMICHGHAFQRSQGEIAVSLRPSNTCRKAFAALANMRRCSAVLLKGDSGSDEGILTVLKNVKVNLASSSEDGSADGGSEAEDDGVREHLKKLCSVVDTWDKAVLDACAKAAEQAFEPVRQFLPLPKYDPSAPEDFMQALPISAGLSDKAALLKKQTQAAKTCSKLAHLNFDLPDEIQAGLSECLSAISTFTIHKLVSLSLWERVTPDSAQKPAGKVKEAVSALKEAWEFAKDSEGVQLPTCLSEMVQQKLALFAS